MICGEYLGGRRPFADASLQPHSVIIAGIRAAKVATPEIGVVAREYTMVACLVWSAFEAKLGFSVISSILRKRLQSC